MQEKRAPDLASFSSAPPTLAAPTLALCGGERAGLVMAMLALAEAWQEQTGGPFPLFIGPQAGLEADFLHQAAGERFEPLEVSSQPQRSGLWGQIRLRGAIALGAWQARRLLRQHRVGVVIGFGGGVTASVLGAARSLGIPRLLFEANAHPSALTQGLSRHASALFAALPEVRTRPGWEQAQVVGLPLRQTVRRAAAALPERHDPKVRHLLITGGTLGSPFLNRTAPDLVGRLVSGGLDVAVIHQTGPSAGDSVRAVYETLGIKATVQPFMPDMAAAWAWADAALCAAGAGTLAEASAFGTPSLVVPVARMADDQQTWNAKAYALPGDSSTHWVSEADWHLPRETNRVAALLKQGRRPPPPEAPPAEQVVIREALALLRR